MSLFAKTQAVSSKSQTAKTNKINNTPTVLFCYFICDKKRKEVKSMATKRKRITEAKKLEFLKLWVYLGSTVKASKELGINPSTARNWTANMTEEEKAYVEKCKNEYVEKFSDEANEIIRKGLIIINRQFDRALENEEELDSLIGEIIEDPETDIAEKKAMILKISKLKLENFKDVSTTVATMYDKKALTEGKPTEHTSFDVNIKVVDG